LLPSTHAGLRDRQARSSAYRRLVGSGLIAGFLLVADQVTKAMAEMYLLTHPEQSIQVIGDVLRLTYVSNRGAAFGILQDRTLVFVIVGIIVVAVILASYRYLPVASGSLNLALGLQLGGAIGNLIDRVRFGSVVDFIDIGPWPVFNLADSGIVIGVGILAYHLLRPADAREP
jgi:signal peptidase II